MTWYWLPLLPMTGVHCCDQFCSPHAVIFLSEHALLFACWFFVNEHRTYLLYSIQVTVEVLLANVLFSFRDITQTPQVKEPYVVAFTNKIFNGYFEVILSTPMKGLLQIRLHFYLVSIFSTRYPYHKSKIVWCVLACFLWNVLKLLTCTTNTYKYMLK